MCKLAIANDESSSPHDQITVPALKTIAPLGDVYIVVSAIAVSGRLPDPVMTETGE